MPLTTKSLTPHDYEPLIDKVRSRMLCWSNRSLSFAGRLQLINSVITSTVNFWSSTFMLPAKCLDTIESLCCAFLWSGCPNQTHKAKVSWADLCFPKAEGGLGVRRLRDSNKVSALKLIWRLFTQHDSMWVCWVRQYLLRQSSFWDVRDTQKGSWMWRKLLKLRDVAYEFFKVEVRDGQTTFFWFDNWLDKGRLIDITGPTGTTYIGLPRRATVSNAVSQDSWAIRGQRSRHHHELFMAITAEPVPDPSLGRDRVLWKIGDGDYLDTFSASKTWEQIREKKAPVAWSKVVWFVQGVPRFSFITWLAVKNRLSTGERMRSWGMVQSCTFCAAQDETRDQLFFACAYSFTVWQGLAHRILGARIDPDWQLTLEQLQDFNGDSLDKILIRMLFQMVIYHLWRERNSRRHHSGWVSTEAMCTVIDKTMRNRICSLKYRAGHKHAGLLQRWFSHTL